MNGATREQIMSALLTLLQTRCGANFQTYSRNFITWQDLMTMVNNAKPVPAMPALFLYEGMGFPHGGLTQWRVDKRGAPAIRTVDINIVIYTRRPGAGTPGGPTGTPFTNQGATTLNPLLEVVEAAMAPDNAVTNLLQLGFPPLVWHAWIEGEGAMVPGDIDPSGIGMQTIPVRIMIP